MPEAFQGTRYFWGTGSHTPMKENFASLRAGFGGYMYSLVTE